MKDLLNGICPYCREPVLPYDPSVTCPHCGITLHQSCWEDNEGCTTFGCPATVTGLSAEGSRACPQCGTVNEPGATQCKSCGRSLSGALEDATPPLEPAAVLVPAEPLPLSTPAEPEPAPVLAPAPQPTWQQPQWQQPQWQPAYQPQPYRPQPYQPQPYQPQWQQPRQGQWQQPQWQQPRQGQWQQPNPQGFSTVPGDPNKKP